MPHCKKNDPKTLHNLYVFVYMRTHARDIEPTYTADIVPESVVGRHLKLDELVRWHDNVAEETEARVDAVWQLWSHRGNMQP